MKKITIAIDGFSSCGKSTMAKDLAREVGYIYIDSGAMYRAVTLYCLENNLFTTDGIDTARLETLMSDIRISFQLNPETGRPMTYLNGVNVEDRIRTMEVSTRVSPVAALPFVREALVKSLHLADGGLAAGGHMPLMDDGNELFGADFVKLPVGFTRNGNGKRGNIEAGLFGLLCGIERRCIGENANHDEEPFRIYHISGI